MSQTVKDAEPPLAHCGVFLISFFFFFYHPEWDHGSCCKSYRGNKRCLVLNFHAASPEQFPYRRAIRVIPQFKKKKETSKEEEKKTTHPFVVYCPVKRASAPSILTQWSFQMLKGGEGVVDGVG